MDRFTRRSLLAGVAGGGLGISVLETAQTRRESRDSVGANQTDGREAGGPRIEVPDCTAARITGDFHLVSLGATSNAPDGVDTHHAEIPREDLTEESDGSIVVRSTDLWPDQGVNGSVLTSIAVEDEDYNILASTRNYECGREARPVVDVSLETVTETDTDAYTVTFRYRNHHEMDLRVYPELRGTVADDETPPRSLQPGEHTFSIEWIPDEPDERLVWGVGFHPEWVGFDEPVTVETNTASEYQADTPSEPTSRELPPNESDPGTPNTEQDEVTPAIEQDRVTPTTERDEETPTTEWDGVTPNTAKDQVTTARDEVAPTTEADEGAPTTEQDAVTPNTESEELTTNSSSAITPDATATQGPGFDWLVTLGGIGGLTGYLWSRAKGEDNE